MPLIDAELMKILACPKCHGDLKEEEAKSRLVCAACRLAYPVKDGIPVMLIDEAEKI